MRRDAAGSQRGQRSGKVSHRSGVHGIFPRKPRAQKPGVEAITRADRIHRLYSKRPNPLPLLPAVARARPELHI